MTTMNTINGLRILRTLISFFTSVISAVLLILGIQTKDLIFFFLSLGFLGFNIIAHFILFILISSQESTLEDDFDKLTNLEQKTDEQKTDEQKTDEQKTDEQKTDEQKTDEQKPDKNNINKEHKKEEVKYVYTNENGIIYAHPINSQNFSLNHNEQTSPILSQPNPLLQPIYYVSNNQS